MAVPIPTFDLDGVAEYIAAGKAKKILVMCGAGISVAAGIPDFRTPGTGLYSKLSQYNLPTPQHLFTLSYLRNDPQVFYSVANDMKLWPDTFAPTHVHHFIKLLDEKGLLFKCCTQNIDCLERSAGLTDDKLIEAHGSFASAFCIDCREKFDAKKLQEIAKEGSVPRCEVCGGIAKPGVIFFGEPLPMHFIEFLMDEASKADLLIVIGTSLKVHPFASLTGEVSKSIPRVVINNQRVGGDFFFKCDEATKMDQEPLDSDSEDEFLLAKLKQFAADGRQATRDTLIVGDCQKIVQELAKKLGFEDELKARFQRGVEEAARITQAKNIDLTDI